LIELTKQIFATKYNFKIIEVEEKEIIEEGKSYKRNKNIEYNLF